MTKRQDFDNNPMWKKNLISEKDLRNLYTLRQLSIHKISTKYGTDYTTIKRRLKYYNMPLRSKEENSVLKSEQHPNRLLRDSNSIKGNRKNYLEIAKKNKTWKCETCGALKSSDNFDLIVHHKDNNNRNNNIKNLMVLCQSCHIKIHKPRLKR